LKAIDTNLNDLLCIEPLSCVVWVGVGVAVGLPCATHTNEHLSVELPTFIVVPALVQAEPAVLAAEAIPPIQTSKAIDVPKIVNFFMP
jgi:hypothetical protein